MSTDRAKVLAYIIDRNNRCPSCGTHHDEWKDNPNAYVVETHRCIGCERLSLERKTWEEEPSASHGIYFKLVDPDSQEPITLPGPSLV